MGDRRDPSNVGDLGHFPDGSPKSSPDDTSLLGLHAVWSELDEPLPRKADRHGTRRARRRAKAPWRVPLPLVIGLSVAVGLTVGIILFIATS